MVRNRNLTTTQQNALDIYERYVARYGERPSIAGFARLLGSTKNNGQYMLTVLREKGYIPPRPPPARVAAPRVAAPKKTLTRLRTPAPPVRIAKKRRSA